MEVWIGMAVFMGVMYYFDYKEKALKYMYKKGAETDEKLLARIDALEKKCEMLQEQVTDAHAQLVDERRMLDQKLAEKLAEGSAAIPGENARQKSPTPQRSLL